MEKLKYTKDVRKLQIDFSQIGPEVKIRGTKKKKVSSIKKKILAQRELGKEEIHFSETMISNQVTPELNTLATELISKVAERQRNEQKVKKKNTKKKKRKVAKRYVFGMKESIAKLKIFRDGSVSVIVLAPDIEKVEGPGGTVERVEKLKMLAKRNKVPVVYACSKQELGRVIQDPQKKARKIQASSICVLNCREFREEEYEKNVL